MMVQNYRNNNNNNNNNQEDESCPLDGLRWLVTLCGKTVDMAYLAQQETTAQVVGVDGVQKALKEFAQEHPDLEIQPVDDSNNQHPAAASFEQFAGKKITLIRGDFFALDAAVTGGPFDAILDRASLVAIDPSMREDYLKTISKLIKRPGGQILLVTLDRRTGEQEAINKGPPYSISEAQVRSLYEGQDWVESVTLLEEIDEFEKDPSAKEKVQFEGITSMYELYFLIKTK